MRTHYRLRAAVTYARRKIDAGYVWSQVPSRALTAMQALRASSTPETLRLPKRVVHAVAATMVQDELTMTTRREKRCGPTLRRLATAMVSMTFAVVSHAATSANPAGRG